MKHTYVDMWNVWSRWYIYIYICELWSTSKGHGCIAWGFLKNAVAKKPEECYANWATASVPVGGSWFKVCCRLCACCKQLHDGRGKGHVCLILCIKRLINGEVAWLCALSTQRMLHCKRQMDCEMCSCMQEGAITNEMTRTLNECVLLWMYWVQRLFVVS